MNPKGNPSSLTAPRFKPSQSGNPGGKPTGSRNWLQGDFVKKLAADFDEHGKKAIVEAREKDPMGYIRTIASLLPKEVELARPLDGLTDAELTAIAAQLRSVLSAPKDRTGTETPPEFSTVN